MQPSRREGRGPGGARASPRTYRAWLGPSGPGEMTGHRGAQGRWEEAREGRSSPERWRSHPHDRCPCLTSARGREPSGSRLEPRAPKLESAAVPGPRGRKANPPAEGFCGVDPKTELE